MTNLQLLQTLAFLQTEHAPCLLATCKGVATDFDLLQLRQTVNCEGQYIPEGIGTNANSLHITKSGEVEFVKGVLITTAVVHHNLRHCVAEGTIVCLACDVTVRKLHQSKQDTQSTCIYHSCDTVQHTPYDASLRLVHIITGHYVRL